jgi:hypothetical protein
MFEGLEAFVEFVVYPFAGPAVELEELSVELV